MKRKIVERGAYGLSVLATKLETDNRTSTAVRDERTTLQQSGALRREDDAVVGMSSVSARALRQVLECRRPDGTGHPVIQANILHCLNTLIAYSPPPQPLHS